MFSGDKRNIVLVGDSTLDNYHWVKPDGLATVEDRLKSKLSKDDKVINLAMDGFTTADVLNGASKAKAIIDDKHPNELFFPLSVLSDVASSNPTLIFLSVGGNDFREALGKLVSKKPAERMKYLEELVSTTQQNLICIMKLLKVHCRHAKIALMLQYTPDVNEDVYFIYYLMQQIVDKAELHYVGAFYHRFISDVSDEAVKQLHKIMKMAYAPVIKYARDCNIPILDMATSFDQTNKALFVKQIEPSSQGAALIVDMMMHVLTQHDFNGPSFMYVKPGCLKGPILAIRGNEEWQPHAIPLNAENKDNAAAYFMAIYERKLNKESSAWLGAGGLFAAKRGLPEQANFDQIVQRARDGDKKVLDIMKELGWPGDINTNAIYKQSTISESVIDITPR